MSIVLELRGADYRYPGGAEGLRDCSVTLRRGCRHALLGANGAGKSTLLLHLNGLLRPQAGSLRLDGRAVDYGRAGLSALRQRVGLVFQNPERQLVAARVEEDVAFGPLNLGLDTVTVRARVAAALAMVGLPDYGPRAVHHLSFGQKKRICIAGVLAMQPDVLLLDEPMAGLDAPMQAELAALLDRLAAGGVSVLLSTHDPDFAFGWADQLHLMAGGACIGAGTPAQLAGQHTLLRAAGLRAPMAAALHAALATAGVLPPAASPRTLADLLERLHALPQAAYQGEP